MQGVLVFRNVRITGQRLVWEDCTEEWCTHCLAPPYLWPGLVDFTVIDHHPAASPSDPYYLESLCEDSNFVFFSVTNSLIIDNCALDNIRIRAVAFIELLEGTSLIITNTTINRMDFKTAFILGSTQQIYFNGLHVSGFNRDHAYTSDIVFDAGFLRLTAVTNLTMSNSLFDDNIQLTFVYSILPFFSAASYVAAIFDTCVFRNSMHNFLFAADVSDFSSLVIRKCCFEDDLSLSLLPYWYISCSKPGEVLISDSVFSNVTARSTSLFSVHMAERGSVLEIIGTKFINNKLYEPRNVSNGEQTQYLQLYAETVLIGDSVFRVSAGDSSNLVRALISQGLMNNNSDVYTDLVERPPSSCQLFLLLDICANVNLRNVSFSDNPACGTMVSVSGTVHTEIQLNVEKMTLLRTVGGLKVSAYANGVFRSNISHSQFDSEVDVEDFSASTLALIVANCDFTRGGISFIGTHFEVLSSRFVNISAPYGAIDCIVKDNRVTEATLLIFNSSFMNNRGEKLASDISIRSVSVSTSLNLVIRGSNFSNFLASSEGSISIERQLLNEAVIESCRFGAGFVSPEMGVIMTTHAKGTLNFKNVLFDSVNIPASYLISVISPSLPHLGLPTLTNLTYVSILNCTYRAAVTLKGQYWLTWLHSYQCRIAGNRGVAVQSETSGWVDVESVLEDNSAEDYPCYFQVQRSVGQFQGTQFLRNTANLGSCLYLRGLDSSGVFTECLFQQNRADVSAGVMRIEQSPTVKITACRFIANTAPRASAMLLVDVWVSLHLTESVLRENQGNGVVVLSNSFLTLEHTSVFENAGTEEGGLVLIRSSVLAKQVSFSRQTGAHGCFFSASFSSSVSLTACNVSQITCLENIVEITSNSTLSISHSSFEDLRSIQSNIILIEDGRLQAESFRATGMTSEQAFLSTLRTTVSVKLSNWTKFTGQGIRIEASELFSLSQSEVRDVWAANTKAVMECNGQQILLTGVFVSNVTGEFGLRVQGNRVQVINCDFGQIQGREGAVWVKSWELEVADSVFLHNRALSENSSGALTVLTNSSLIRNCTFAFNTAQSGAALYYLLTVPTLFNTIFAANQAFYGPAIASYPAKLLLLNQSDIIVASGQSFLSLVIIGVCDNRNQLVKTYTNNQAWLVGTGVSGNVFSDAKNGVFSFSNFTVTGNTGQVVILTVSHSSLRPLPMILRIRNCLWERFSLLRSA